MILAENISQIVNVLIAVPLMANTKIIVVVRFVVIGQENINQIVDVLNVNNSVN